MFLWIIRICFILILIVSWLGVIIHPMTLPDVETQEMDYTAKVSLYVTLGLISLLIILGDLLIHDRQITTFSAIYFGLLLGLGLGALVGIAVEPLMSLYPTTRVLLPPTRVLITVWCAFVAVSTLLQTKDEFRFIIPYVEFSKQLKGGRPLVLDTSVIIDGRIADICDTRIVDNPLLVPRFVLQELQAVADSADKLKRNRGRRGLDILKRMQGNPKIELQMHEADLEELRNVHKVDERLVVFAKVLGARVVTNDFNLNKIAQLQGVDVININELANAVKSVALPGEVLTVRVVKPGDQIGQGVGYLEDGTMVVVEQGRSAIGQEVTLVVTSVLQTPAGRMIFGKFEGKPGQERQRTETNA